MANYANLKADIQAVIKQNGNQEITGNILQQSLIAMINSLGNGYLYKGIATPSTNPGSPDQNIYYIATTAGEYVNMGNVTLGNGEVAIIKYNGSWSKDVTGIASQQQLSQLGHRFGYYLSADITVDFYLKTVQVSAGYLFFGDTAELRVDSSSSSFDGMTGLVYLVISQANNTIYLTQYSTPLVNPADHIIGSIAIDRQIVQAVKCKTLTIDGSVIIDFNTNDKDRLGPLMYFAGTVTVNKTNKTVAYSNGYVFNGNKGFGYNVTGATLSWENKSGLQYIALSRTNRSLYIVGYNEEFANSDDVAIGIIDVSGNKVDINCRELIIDGSAIILFTQDERESIEKLLSVNILPEPGILPVSNWPEKNFNSQTGTDGIFWDMRNNIGPERKLKSIHIRSAVAGIVRIHYLNTLFNTVAYEDHSVINGNTTIVPTTDIDYSQVLYVAIQNVSSAMRLVYPSDGSGQGKKKLLSDDTITDNTYAYAYWLDVENYENTLPSRVTKLEGEVSGITTLAELQLAIAGGVAHIILGECDITLASTLLIPSGTKISGVRGKSIIRVPAEILKGIELNAVEDVVIENITLVGAYNGTPIKSGMQPVRPGIVDEADDARQFVGAGYQTDMDNGGITSTYIPQIGINIKACEKVEILGCEIKNFSYYGIANALSGKNYRYAMKVQNNYINNCYCGLYLYKEAERSQYISNNVSLCQIGVYLDSGTNMFTDNAFSANRIGMFMNNGVNHAHGVQTGNAYSHCSLLGLYANNIENGEVFSQCKFGYVDIESGNDGYALILKNSRGLAFENCQMIKANIKIDGKFYLAYSGYSGGPADVFGNTNYVVSYTDITDEPSQYNGGVNMLLGCSFLTGGGTITKSSDLDNTNVILKNNHFITGQNSSGLNN